ncbi:hypothetical protein PAXINDRAFT_17091 [Paxillus involutus ATCC 200175]|uniref:Uncharacterized protein n=1 Tax=Paxillus involutus ATCC 200175 TaxID=664439 RepID=A0A0C9SQR6_PAXIN|nr:hypothetical protein PAXINDRAFT_17091 [Paxillus involutus ATCC 200175]
MSHHNFLKSPLGPEMNRCWTEITIDFNIIGAASDLRKIFEHFPPENQPWMHRVFWHYIQRLMNATTSLMGHSALLGITPTLHPILQHVARNAAAMEADGFNIDDIPPFKWDSTNLTFRAIVTALSDAWWEDLDALREDPDPMNWEYIPNMKGNNQFWEALKDALLGITPTLHPILQHVARNAAAMEADGFNIDDIPPFKWDSTNLTFRAIVTALSDAWWEDLDALREDPDPMNWEYIPNMKGNNQFWEALKEYSEEATGQNIPSQSPLRLLHNIHNSINALGDDINTIQADIEVTTRSLSRLLSRAPEDSMVTLAEIRSRLGQGEDRFWARQFEEMDTIIAKGSVADV